MGFKNKTAVNPNINMVKGDSFEGIYQGTKECEAKKDKKKFNVHTFNVEGVDMDLMGCGSLDFQIMGRPASKATKTAKAKEAIEAVEIGATCKVSYFGKEMANIDGVMREINNYNVAVWEDEDGDTNPVTGEE